MVSSAPFLYAGIWMCKDNVWAAYVLVFIGEAMLNMNWAVVVDIGMVRSVLLLVCIRKTMLKMNWAVVMDIGMVRMVSVYRVVW